MGDKYDFQEFAKLDIRIGTVTLVERVENTDKLIKVVVDLGNETRQVVAGFGHLHEPKDLIGKQIPVVLNIKETDIKGVKSQGVFVALDDEGATLLLPEKKVDNGTKLK